MTQLEAVNRTRMYLKDYTENVWSNTEIKQFINDAIDIIKAGLEKYFTDLHRVPNREVADPTPDVIHIKPEYEMLIPLYAASRCFDQDEQFYRATQLMNEFETRRTDMENKVLESADSTDDTNDYVVDVYGTNTDSEL